MAEILLFAKRLDQPNEWLAGVEAGAAPGRIAHRLGLVDAGEIAQQHFVVIGPAAAKLRMVSPLRRF